MSSNSVLKVSGLQLAPNELGAVPEGALVVADNVVIRAKDVIEPRRGQEAIPNVSLPSTSDAVFFFKGETVVSCTNDSLSHFPAGGSLTTYPGTFAPPDSDSHILGAEAQGALFLTTSKGVMKLDTPSGPPVRAGAPKSAELFNVGEASGSSGYLAPGKRVAYRVCFCRKDANGMLLIGPPSGRAFAQNVSEVDCNTTVSIVVPDDVTTEVFYRVYRTAQSDADVDPGDEMGLVQERFFTADDIAASFVTFTDTTTDDFRGAPLHTNPNSGEGILQANDPPPFAYDVAYWAGRMWYANTRQPQRYYLDLLGAGPGVVDSGATGVRIGDTLHIGGLNYIGWTFNDPGRDEADTDFARPFQVVTDGTPSSNLEKTARNLVEVINRDFDNGSVRAYYISGPSDVPGKIAIEAVNLGDAPFAVTLTSKAFASTSLARYTDPNVVEMSLPGHPFVDGDLVRIASSNPDAYFDTGTFRVSYIDESTIQYTNPGPASTSTFNVYTATRVTPAPSSAWNPELPASGTSQSSTDDAAPHRIFYSKIQQPEAVPLLNYLDVGTRNSPVLRIVPLRDRLFVFKPEGIFVISGDAPFRVDLLDNTARLKGPRTAVPLNNQIYCLSNLGVIAVSDGGVTVVSRPIEPELRRAQKFGFIQDFRAFGVAHETERIYIVGLTSNEDSTYPDVFYVYNTAVNAWTRWLIYRNCGAVNPETDALTFGAGNSNQLLAENLEFYGKDYADEEGQPAVTLGAVNSSGEVQVTFGVDVGTPDDFLESSSGFSFRPVSKRNSFSQQYVTLSPVPEAWQLPVGTTLRLKKGITTEVVWAANAGGDPSIGKQFRELRLHFKQAHFHEAEALFQRNGDEDPKTVSLEDHNFSKDSPPNWGDLNDPEMIRTLVPVDQQRAEYLRVGFKVKGAWSLWQLNGYSLHFEPVSASTVR